MRERLAELEGLLAAVSMMGFDPQALAQFGREAFKVEPFQTETLLKCIRLDDDALLEAGLNKSDLLEYRRRYESLMTPGMRSLRTS